MFDVKSLLFLNVPIFSFSSVHGPLKNMMVGSIRARSSLVNSFHQLRVVFKSFEFRPKNTPLNL